jgi:hypothetical protein
VGEYEIEISQGKLVGVVMQRSLPGITVGLREQMALL